MSSIQVSAASISTFQTDGYLVVEDLLSAAEVHEARAGLSDIFQRAFAKAKAGEATYQPPHPEGATNYSGARIRGGGMKVDVQFERHIQALELSSHDAELMFRNMYHYQSDHPFFEALVKDERIVGRAEALIGETAQLFQVMALSKPARIGSEKPWHQDDAYFKFAPLDKIIGVWIALDDASVENGCMHVLPGGHRRGALRHEHTFDCKIDDSRLRDASPLAVPIKAGGALFFSGLLPHQTPPNRTDVRRRALQFHYRGQSTAEVDNDVYDTIFVEADGTPASCAAARHA